MSGITTEIMIDVAEMRQMAIEVVEFEQKRRPMLWYYTRKDG